MIRLFSAMLLASTALAAQPRDMKAFFLQTCAACHGQDGSARSLTGARLAGRAFTDTRWQAKQTDSQLVKSILKGKGAMPAFGAQLKEEEALRLVTDIVRPFAAHKK